MAWTGMRSRRRWYVLPIQHIRRYTNYPLEHCWKRVLNNLPYLINTWVVSYKVVTTHFWWSMHLLHEVRGHKERYKIHGIRLGFNVRTYVWGHHAITTYVCNLHTLHYIVKHRALHWIYTYCLSPLLIKLITYTFIHWYETCRHGPQPPG